MLRADVPDVIKLEAIDAWIEEGLEPVAPWLGLWLLENDREEAFGCVRLSAPEDEAASAELTYLLDPTVWGRGLATRMARTALARAFARGADTVLAGVDAPNTDSIAVLRRLGMRFLRDVDYPSGPGVEYVLSSADFDPPGAGEAFDVVDER